MIELNNLPCAQEELVAVDAIARSQVYGGGSISGSSTASISSVVSTTSISNIDNPDGNFSVVRKVSKSSKTVDVPLQIDDSTTNIFQQVSL